MMTEINVASQSTTDVSCGLTDARNGVLPFDTDSSDSEKSDDSDDSRSTTNGCWKRSKRANTFEKVEIRHPLKKETSLNNAAFAEASMIIQKQPTRTDSNKLKSKFNVWSNVLAEQGLVQDLNLVGVHGGCVPNERDCESYDYTMKYRLQEPYEGSRDIHRRLGLKRNAKDRSSSNLPLLEKNRRSFSLSENDPKEKVVEGIAAILREPKIDLLNRVVSILGEKKAIELLERTEDIEESGGMLTLDGFRRRTPGGVFFQLLKRDRDILKSEVDEIFEEDRAESLETFKHIKNAKKKRSKNKKKTKMEVTESEPLPMLPTLQELLLTRDTIKNEMLAEGCSEKLGSTYSEKEPGELDSDDSIAD